MDNKQVVILVPTTILAEQHYKTFNDRLKSFPVKVEMLSRFKTKKQQQDILKQVSQGNIDIIIGTHRLLSGDVSFKDIGLVIIDEEQRFGVKDKEKLKKMRLLVDVLTMTATPIPRTLYMSLMGVKDMSTINTPPPDRLPIETYVKEFDQGLIKEALTKELKRKGQVFFIHNRVEDIDLVAKKVSKAVPGARIAVGHGQMSSRQLEEVMLNFIDKKIDVLVSTTIVESGIDIPNANTIMINNADAVGLAELYQLRGRVGRFNVKAYAYFLIRKGLPLTRESEKRLRAIENFTGLGAGFRIAMEDLKLRGAGNLLGPQQHGYVNAVGFDLYCRILRDAVSDLKNRKVLSKQ
jgi:transcription-repair coupling factor (superfamily II helicase)